MHEHGSAGDGGAIQALLLAALVVTAAVHLGGRFAGGGRRVDGYLVGHALMTAGMVWMLLPSSWVPQPPTSLALLFGLSGGAFAALVVRHGHRRGWWEALRCGDLAVGHGAMAYMVGPARIRWSLATGLLVVYFVVLALASAGLFAGRAVALDLPEEAFGPATAPRSSRRGLIGRADAVTNRSAAAHAAMGAAMVYMLGRV